MEHRNSIFWFSLVTERLNRGIPWMTTLENGSILRWRGPITRHQAGA